MKDSAALYLRVVLQEAADELNESLRQLASTNPKNWRRALLEEPKHRESAKYLREPRNAANVPTVMRMNELAIDRQLGLPDGAVQRRAPVQELTEHEQEFMEVFDSLGTVVTAQALADAFECSVKSLRWRELHDLQVKGVIESKRGQRGGYRRVRA